MRVVVADAEADVRAALRLLLTSGLAMCVVGEAADTAGLCRQLRDASPGAVLLAWELLGVEAGRALARLCATHPQVRFVVLSTQPQVRPQALAAGAHAFVSKADSPEQVSSVLRGLRGEGGTHDR
jgi:DNA-binding NarL/FixJ family response regulator